MYRNVLIFLFIPSVVNCYKIEVKVKQGRILGTREVTLFDDRLYFAFYRVPYAQRPIKKLRFKDPLPVKKWNHTLDARTPFHGVCAQAHIVHKNSLYGVEDCLYLNVYTPNIPNAEYEDKKTTLKPVIVWIHGYAFTSSFSHMFGADFFIENEVLFITVCHRIGVFGFLKLNDTDSHVNMGLKDIIAALKWIRKNVIYFGGDKRRITVMSSGSAATFVSLLMTDKKSRKLFSKLILQSGSIFSPSIFLGDHRLEKGRFLDNLHKKNINLKKATTKEVVLASKKIYSKQELENFQRPIVPFTPVISISTDDPLTLKTPDSFYEIANNDTDFHKPILIGYNTQESISELIPFIHNPRLLKSFGNIHKYMVPFSSGCIYSVNATKYHLAYSKIKEYYFKAGLSEKSLDSFLRYTSDLTKYPLVKFIKTHLKRSNGKMYVYKFDYRGNFNAVKTTSLGGTRIKIKGAASGDELCYLLTCEPLLESYAKLKNTNSSNNRDRYFMKNITKLWSNFAKFGDPTPLSDDDNIIWPPMSLKNNKLLFIGNTMKIISNRSEKSMFDFWNDLYESYYKDDRCSKDRDEL